MSNAAALNGFLASVERRAFRIARYAVSDSEAALDLVQDAMFTLARKYATRPETEWSPLFFRILRNRITDFHRRRIVQNGIFALFPGRRDAATDPDPMEQVAGSRDTEPEFRGDLDRATQRLHRALAELPARQREAFLLRAWEGLDVAGTARAMRCSEGSVKTHYSRAVHKLRERLEGDWS